MLIDPKDRKDFLDFRKNFLSRVNKEKTLKTHIVQYTDWSKNTNYEGISSAIDWVPKKYPKQIEEWRKHIGDIYSKIFLSHKGAVFVYETDPPYEQSSACGCQIAYFPGWSNKHKTLQPGWKLRPYHLDSEIVQFFKEVFPICNTVRFLYIWINSYLDPEFGINELKRFKLKPKRIEINGFKKSSTGFIRHTDKLMLNQMYEIK